MFTAGITLSQERREGERFTIQGEITGLAVGDTLRFEVIELPMWNLAPGFDVVVATTDSFEYTGHQPHSQYYLMTYLPHTGKVAPSSKRGLTMIVGGGTVTVNGSTDEIYFSRVDGEAFGRQPLLREATDIENAIDRERSRYLGLANEAFAAADSIKGREYIKMFSEFRRDGDEQRRVDELRGEFLRRNPASEWSIVYRLERSSNTPLDTLETHYARLDATAHAGYFGSLLGKTIDERRRLQPGQPAPGFRATLPDGTAMDIEDFRGKYLLIYHWGFCPGSIQLEKEATDLYNRFSDKLVVLGITQSLEAIRSAAQKASPDDEFFGVKLKPAFESMAAHPWMDVESGTGENGRIGELYAFGAVEKH